MFKTGSKFLFGLAALGLVGAVLYSWATGQHELGMDSLLGPLTLGYKGYVGEHVGYSVLISLSFASLFLGTFLSALRDADPEDAAAAAHLETVPEAPVPAGTNYWPVVAAFSLAAVVLGLAVGPTLFVVGLVGLAVTTVEWAARAWSERATGDAEVNRQIRNRIMSPVEIPVGAVIGIGAMVFLVSRILLAVPEVGGYIVFGLVPTVVLAIGALIALRPRVSSSVIAAILVAGGLAILAGGVAATIHGKRESHEKSEHSSEEGLPAPGSATIVVGN
jgi:hypothetical protein